MFATRGRDATRSKEPYCPTTRNKKLLGSPSSAESSNVCSPVARFGIMKAAVGLEHKYIEAMVFRAVLICFVLFASLFGFTAGQDSV